MMGGFESLFIFALGPVGALVTLGVLAVWVFLVIRSESDV